MSRYDAKQLVSNVEASLGQGGAGAPGDGAGAPLPDPLEARLWGGPLGQMSQHQDVASVPRDTRLGFFKRALARLFRMVSAKQSTFNAGTLEAVAQLARELDAERSRALAAEARTEALLAALDAELARASAETRGGAEVLAQDVAAARRASEEMMEGRAAELRQRIAAVAEEIHQRVGMEAERQAHAHRELAGQASELRNRSDALERRVFVESEELEAERAARLEETIARAAWEAKDARRGLTETFEALDRALAEQIAQLHQRITDTADTLAREQGRQNAQLESNTSGAQDAGVRAARAHELAVRLEARVQAVQERLTLAAPSDILTQSRNDSEAPTPLLDEAGYQELQRLFRGSAAQLAERARESLAAIGAACGDAAGRRLVDLGCGDGVFLDEANKAGWRGFGVDSNRRAVAEAGARGVEAAHADAVGWLRLQPAASCAALTAFQVVEHLGDEDLRGLLAESLRVLEPGGHLFLETINPRTLHSLRWYLMDPTHRRFLDPELLRFLGETLGFLHAATHFIHPVEEAARLSPPPGEPERANAAKLNAFLYGPQDYLLVLRRPAPTG
ncbi:MAG: methyltransferase domain-containing protein [Candidatus Sumerlaeia bacterium]|nr:methyltransferase domain-containing protein [Candidatus Sumerlaeia bacterium]